MRFVDRAEDTLFWVLPHVKDEGGGVARQDGIECFIFAWNPSYPKKSWLLVEGIDITGASETYRDIDRNLEHQRPLWDTPVGRTC